MDRKTHMGITEFYTCAEEIAQILDKYQHNSIEDMSNINDLIEKEKKIDKFIAEHGERPHPDVRPESRAKDYDRLAEKKLFT